MKSITMLALRRNAAAILKEIAKGKTMVLTYRGRPTVRLSPIQKETRTAKSDPFYALSEIASKRGVSLRNEKMDRVIYRQ